jgi:hypothetical protein
MPCVRAGCVSATLVESLLPCLEPRQVLPITGLACKEEWRGVSRQASCASGVCVRVKAFLADGLLRSAPRGRRGPGVSSRGPRMRSPSLAKRT